MPDVCAHSAKYRGRIARPVMPSRSHGFFAGAGDVLKVSKASRVSKLSRAGRLTASITDGAGRMCRPGPTNRHPRK
jgi:hypothetical protein